MPQRLAGTFMRSAAVAAAVLAAASGLPRNIAAEPQGPATYFLVQVQDERFVLAVLDAKAIRDANDCLAGRRRLIPIGEIAPGDGGFNTGHGWHLKPQTVKFAEVAMEVCDGRPSDVGNITSRVFCPWTARIVARLPDKP